MIKKISVLMLAALMTCVFASSARCGSPLAEDASAAGYLSLISSLTRIEKREDALRYIGEALEIFPRSTLVPVLRFGAGEINNKLSKWYPAAYNYQKFLFENQAGLDSKYLRSIYKQLKLDEGALGMPDLKDARKKMEYILKAESSKADFITEIERGSASQDFVYYLWGYRMYLLNDYTGAIDLFNKVLSARDSSDKNIVAEAEKYLQKSYDKMAEKEYQTGVFYLRRKKYSSALIYFQSVVAVSTDNIWVVPSWYNSARCCFMLSRDEEAIGYIESIKASGNTEYAAKAEKLLKAVKNK